jgi:hypothetical protein
MKKKWKKRMSKGKDIAKCFVSMPSELEQYNPDALKLDDNCDEWFQEVLDENEEQHSYDGKPSNIQKVNKSNSMQAFWHSHGELIRCAYMVPNESFATSDSKDQLHSYDDAPAEIRYVSHYNEFELKWRNHGVIHRENDLPALVRWNKPEGHAKARYEEYYYVNGELHREDAKPAIDGLIKKEWFVYGGLHKVDGPACLFTKKAPGRSKRQWGLYGLEMEKRTFDSVLTYQYKTKVPLWVALLYIIGVVTEDKISVFQNESGTWDLTVPLTWVLHLWNVNDDILSQAVHNLRDENYDVWFTQNPSKPSSPTERLMKIVALEEIVVTPTVTNLVSV